MSDPLDTPGDALTRSVLDIHYGEGWPARASGGPPPWVFRTLASWYAMLQRHGFVLPHLRLQSTQHGGAAMRIFRMSFLGVLVALAGCVHGYGCLLEEPIKHTLTGRVHFRSFPAADGMDNVPVLVLDRTAYIYAPAHSYQCMFATDLQLVGVSEFPPSVVENSHVSVEGSLFEATASHEYTRFLMNVTLLLPLAATQ